MPTNHNGDPTGLAATDTVTISNPNDGEANSAASNSSAVNKLADYAKFILANAGFLAVARTWSAIQSFSTTLKPKPATDIVAALDTDVQPTAYKLLWQAGGASQKKLRIYFTNLGELIITLNAKWNGTTWDEDLNALHIRWIGTHDGPFSVQRVAAGTANWADGTWAYSTAGDADLRAGRVLTDALACVAAAAIDVGHALSFSVANPAATAAAKNKLYGSNIAKAWGACPYGSGLTVDTVYSAGVGGSNFDGFNFASFERKVLGGTDHYMRIAFATPMDDANYDVGFTDFPGNPSEAAWLFVKGRSTTGFDVYGMMTPAGGANAGKSFATAGGGSLSFRVFAKQT